MKNPKLRPLHHGEMRYTRGLSIRYWRLWLNRRRRPRGFVIRAHVWFALPF